MAAIIEEVRRRYREEPFKPFAIVLNSGRTIEVRDKFQVAFPTHNRFVFVVEDSGSRDFYHDQDINTLSDIKGASRKRKSA